MKPRSMFAKIRPKGWGKNAKNGNAKGRNGMKRASAKDRELLEYIPPMTMQGPREYLFANCVVLAATVFGRSSRTWAEQMLPSARQLDARRSA